MFCQENAGFQKATEDKGNIYEKSCNNIKHAYDPCHNESTDELTKAKRIRGRTLNDNDNLGVGFSVACIMQLAHLEPITV